MLSCFSPEEDRLVESRRIQRGIEAVYATIMPKGTHPFVYLR
jgi:DNA mismatch repair ATPase MutL